ncbi:hypothetical protein SRABI106_01928 [Rahnella aquatilis]|nr:hypothetical protein SRABI106_01928 [Rahnella aquatilis]
MALEVHQIAAVFFVARTEEVVEAHFVHGRRRLEGSHVAAEFQVFLGRTQNGHDGVPADSSTNVTFQLQVTRVFRFVFNSDGIDVVTAGCASSDAYAALARFTENLIDQELCTLNTFFTDDRFDRL